MVLSLLIGLVAVTLIQRGTGHEAPDAEDGLAGVRAVARAAVGRDLGLIPRGEVRLIPLDSDDLGEATRFAAICEATESEGAPADLVRVSVDRAPEGEPVRVWPAFNLTGTADADERISALSGKLALVAIVHGGRTIGIQAVDFSGEPEGLTEAWGTLDRGKNKISNWQETGQMAGLARQRLMFNPAPEKISAQEKGDRRFELSDETGPLWSVSFAENLGAPPEIEARREGPKAPELIAQVKGQRPHLGWFVDTVRDISWVGPAKIARAEDIAFDVIDWGKRQRAAVFGAPPVEAPVLAAQDTPAHGDQALMAQMPTAQGAAERWRPASERREGRIWPPRAGVPVFEEAGPGEGKWVPMARHIKPAADEAVVFYQSWIRPDKARHFALVSTTAFDPSRLLLGTVAGTREPQSKTGQRGTGQIPRRPEITPRLVAAFNGGFQSKHGSFGMIEETRVIAPPMGEAATVLTTKDERIMMGVWPIGGPRPNVWMRAPGIPTPEWVYGMRQNLDPLVDKGTLNPSKRRKWGSTAGVTSSGVFTVRTGLCLLEGGAMAYFFGAGVSAEMLGTAMLAFHCEHGIHLDMNAGHSGFEFYNVKDVEGKDFEAAKMIQKMWHMNFPRYIKRDGRDYFYLRHRILPMERLGDRTGLIWHPPALSDDAPHHKAPPSGEPARILIADIILKGGESHTELVRLPRAGLTGARIVEATPDGTLPTTAHTVLMGNLAPFEAPDAHLDLSAKAFGALNDEPSESTVPILVLAKEGVSKPPSDALPQTPCVLLAFDDNDVLAALAQPADLSELRRWLLSKGYETIVAIPSPANAGLALRLVSDEGEEAFRGGALRKDRGIWRLDLLPAKPFSERVENHVEATHSGEPLTK